MKNTQLRDLRAWLAVPGNKTKTSAQYAKHLKDKTIIQGCFDEENERRQVLKEEREHYADYSDQA